MHDFMRRMRTYASTEDVLNLDVPIISCSHDGRDYTRRYVSQAFLVGDRADEWGGVQPGDHA